MKVYLQNFLKYKDFFVELVLKDIKLKFRDSVFGILWSMLNPLLFMIVLTIVFSSLFENNIENFPVYVLIGRLVYAFFAEATNFAMDSIYVNGQLIRKVYVPKYFFPLAKICSSFITTLLSFFPLLLIMMTTGIGLSFTNLLIIFPLIYILFFSMGVGLFLSSVTVFFRDIKHLYSVVLMFLMYTSAIFYPVDIIPSEYQKYIQFNPLFGVIEMTREVLMYQSIPSLQDHAFIFLYACLHLFIGFFVFYKTQDKFILHL